MHTRNIYESLFKASHAHLNVILEHSTLISNGIVFTFYFKILVYQ